MSSLYGTRVLVPRHNIVRILKGWRALPRLRGLTLFVKEAQALAGGCTRYVGRLLFHGFVVGADIPLFVSPVIGGREAIQNDPNLNPRDRIPSA